MIAVGQLAKAVIAAWLLVIGIGAATFGILTFVKSDGIGSDVSLPPGHWSMPRLQEDWPDEGAERPFLVPVIPEDQSIDMTLQSAAGAFAWRPIIPCVNRCAYPDNDSDFFR